ncbi:hypothetical protein Ancab_003594, partial [Ancistrocladus abbreviatus]
YTSCAEEEEMLLEKEFEKERKLRKERCLKRNKGRDKIVGRTKEKQRKGSQKRGRGTRRRSEVEDDNRSQGPETGTSGEAVADEGCLDAGKRRAKYNIENRKKSWIRERKKMKNRMG